MVVKKSGGDQRLLRGLCVAVIHDGIFDSAFFLFMVIELEGGRSDLDLGVAVSNEEMSGEHAPGDVIE